MSYLKPIPGICDRCGQRYNLADLNFEYDMGRNTGLRTCKDCNDPTQPQEDTRGLRTDDKQSVKDSRSDAPTLPEERKLWAWNPVGQPADGTLYIYDGKVTVTTT